MNIMREVPAPASNRVVSRCRRLQTLQAALDRSGFSPGEIDGRPGAVTKRALAAFQKEHRLTPTGAIDDKSWAALGVKPGETGEDDHAVLDRRRPRVAWIALECLWSAAGYWSL